MKPELTVVPPPSTARSSRRKPRQTGADLIKVINEEYELEAGGLVLLNETAAALDRLNEVADCINRDGVMLKWGRGRRQHPLLKVEVQLRSLIGRNLQRLGVGLEPIGDIGRPPGGVGIGWDDIGDD